MIIRAKTFKQWLQANLDSQQIEELAEHGADAGWPGLTYYNDTVKLYERFNDEIWNLIVNEAEECGYKNPYELLATFSGAKNVQTYTQHANLMTWFAAEHYAQELANA